MQIEVHVADRDDVPVADDDATGGERRRSRGSGREHSAARRRRAIGERSPQRAREPARVTHREGERCPAGPAGEVHDGRRDVGDLEDGARIAGSDAAVAVHVRDGVGVVDDALEPVLGQQHGDAEVVHEPGDGREDVFGRVRIECGGRFVEHQPRGCAVSTDPIATRCCCPPESVRSGRARSSAMPRRSSVSSTRLRITSGGSPSCSIAYASSSSTVSVTKPADGS